jgi:hypothetical protein
MLGPQRASFPLLTTFERASAVPPKRLSPDPASRWEELR